VKLQKNCGVDTLKMSDYGIKPEKFETLAKNVKDTMGGLFQCDRIAISIDDCIAIYRNSYK
jgi:alcohol dehydrogenase